MITWPDMTFPPINLYSAPRYIPKKWRECQGKCHFDSYHICTGCHRHVNQIFNNHEENNNVEII